MVPRELIATARVPGGADLQLVRRGGDFMIVLDRNELMSSRMSGSEEALATLTCARLSRRKTIHLLVGGYGMGFTLRAALKMLGADARVTVAEIVPEIIDWARGPMAELMDGCLEDKRVRLILGDVAQVIVEGPGSYDAILLDVDNGPDGLSRTGNDGLYSPRGLAIAREALKPGGVLAVWSAGPDRAFARRMTGAAFATEEVSVSARSNGKGPRHTIWFGTKPGWTNASAASR